MEFAVGRLDIEKSSTHRLCVVSTGGKMRIFTARLLSFYSGNMTTVLGCKTVRASMELNLIIYDK